jgi:hypothetical protein
VHSRLYDHLQVNDLLFKHQSGFLPGHNVDKQLVSIVNMILSNSFLGLETRGVFLDISGAFDAVPHFLLLKKLKLYGVCGKVMVYTN